MNCIEARRMVAPFVKKELSEKETEQFLRHIEHCSDCMDELDIYFTVYKALDTLDSGTHQEYNFQKMMKEELRAAKRSIVIHKAFHIFRFVILVMTELLLVISLYTGIEMKRGEMKSSTFHRAIHSLSSGKKNDTGGTADQDILEETEPTEEPEVVPKK